MQLQQIQQGPNLGPMIGSNTGAPSPSKCSSYYLLATLIIGLIKTCGFFCH